MIDALTTPGDSPLWAEVIRSVIVGLAGVILGMAFQVVTAYGRIAIRGGGALPRHVTLIALSYCLLIVVTAGTQLEFLLQGTPPTWRIPIIVCAYLLGVIALRLVLVGVTDALKGPRRRRNDP